MVINEFYVYALLDPRRPTLSKIGFEPFYIGKGKGNRGRSHLKVTTKNTPKHNKINKIFSEGETPIMVKLAENMSEVDAFELEELFIASLGRINLSTGILTNLSNGGEGVSGAVYSPEVRARMRESKLGKSPWNKAKKLSEEHCKNLSDSHIGQEPWNKGNALSLEHKKKLSISHTGKTLSEEHKKAIGDGGRGRTKTIEEIEKIYNSRMAKAGYAHSKESKLKMQTSKYKTYIITDPQGNTFECSSLREYFEPLCINHDYIRAIANGYYKSYRGYICAHKEVTSSQP